MNIKKKIYDMYNDNKDSLINILSHILDDGIEPETLAELIKEDKTLYGIYKHECLTLNLLKKDVIDTLDDVFGGVN